MPTELQELRKEVASVGGNLNKFIQEFSDFKNQYECDMRGNKKFNGEKGIVNELREIKLYHKDNPSLTWLLRHKTLRTILTICGVGLFIYFIGTILLIIFGPTALVEAFLKLLNIPLL